MKMSKNYHFFIPRTKVRSPDPGEKQLEVRTLILYNTIKWKIQLYKTTIIVMYKE